MMLSEEDEEIEIEDNDDEDKDTEQNNDLKSEPQLAPGGDRPDSQSQSHSFDTAAILINLQLLPGIEQTRQVLMTAGIKGAPPIFINATLSEITQSAVIAEALEQLKRALPKMVVAAAPLVTSAKTTKAKVPLPDLPAPNNTTQSNQLSLFT